MEDWQQRIIIEKNDLVIKLDKLTLFIRSDIYKELDILNKKLLDTQAFIMTEYINILEHRIDLF